MGGHARLAKTLREKKQSCEKPSATPQFEKRSNHSRTIYRKDIPRSWKKATLNRCTQRNILLLGKMNHGKSTLGNRILDDDRCFRINDQRCPQTTHGSVVIQSASQFKDYRIDIYDHDGLFEDVTSIDKLPFSVTVELNLNLIIFVLKHGYNFRENEVEVLKSTVNKLKISQISSLVLTHCERLSEKDRGEVIKQFKKDHLLVAKLMGKGILAVGFPDNVESYIDLSEKVEDDKAKLRKLIYSCDKSVFIPRCKPPQIDSRFVICQDIEQPRVVILSSEPPQIDSQSVIRQNIEHLMQWGEGSMVF